MTSYEQRLLDNTADYIKRYIHRDVKDSQTVERLLIYESVHRHRKTVERALVKRLKEVVHVESGIPTVEDLLRKKWL